MRKTGLMVAAAALAVALFAAHDVPRADRRAESETTQPSLSTKPQVGVDAPAPLPVASAAPTPSPVAVSPAPRQPAPPSAADRIAALDPAAASAAAFRSRDGGIEFRVPQPGDPEWADYQAMLQHPAYRSSGTGTRGFAMPYDPEWRALVRGRREAAAIDLDLANSLASPEDLAQAILASLHARDLDNLLQLHVTRREFLELCWPEFPQSRPYLKIPPAEAWSFQQTKCNEAAVTALRSWGGREWTLDGVAAALTTPYQNFTLHEGVTVRAIDGGTGLLTVLDVAPVILERNGRFKVFVYGE